MSKHYTGQIHLTIDDKAATMVALSYKSFTNEHESWYPIDENNTLFDRLVELYCPEWETEKLDNVFLMHLYFGSFTDDAGSLKDLFDFLNFLNNCGVTIFAKIYSKETEGMINAVSLHADPNIKVTFFETLDGSIVETQGQYSQLVTFENVKKYDTTHREYLNFESRFWDSRMERV